MTNKLDKTSKRKNTSEALAVSDYSSYLYLIYIFGFYPIITHNKYFDITVTRYSSFMAGTLAYIFLCGMSIIVCKMLEGSVNTRLRHAFAMAGEKWFERPFVWMFFLMVAHILAYTDAYDAAEVMVGPASRYMGLVTWLVMGVMFILMAQGVRPEERLFIPLALSALYACVIAIFQHMEIDFMNYKGSIKESLYTKFISTFGNINMFASFLGMVIPLFAALFILTKRAYIRYASAVLLFPCGMCIMICNSDSIFLALFAGLFVALLLALRARQPVRFALALCLLAAGNLSTILVNKYGHARYDSKRGGLIIYLDKVPAALIILGATLILLGLTVIFKAKINALCDRVGVKRIAIVLTVLVAVIMIATVIVGVTVIKKGVFKFDYKWGSKRGYIWTKTAELFKDAPLRNKLFGYGDESLKSLMTDYYYTEMIDVTGTVYDNAHCEPLHYLITTGITGLLAYLGLLFVTIRSVIKRGLDCGPACCLLAAVFGYLGQSLITISQPITTPLFFVMLATMSGFSRTCKPRNAA
ncbi:MAG: O-antigen ligase family protein [Lachnospiraceae bacterium]|nr:O-antigen ligase family protein [Lachnospiraceae bacterium]